MNLFVLDATPLIYLAKVGMLEKLKDLPVKIIVPRKVVGEVVEKGKEKGAEDAVIVERLLQASFTIAEESSTEFHKYPYLSPADAQALAVAKVRQGTIIADDDEVRKIAEMEQIEHHGSLYLLFQLVEKNIISKSQAQHAFCRMVEEGWFCSLDLYQEVMLKFK